LALSEGLPVAASFGASTSPPHGRDYTHGHGHRTHHRPRRIALDPQDELTLTNGRLVLLEFWIGLVDWRDMTVTKEEPRVFRLEFECLIFGRLYMLMCNLRF